MEESGYTLTDLKNKSTTPSHLRFLFREWVKDNYFECIKQIDREDTIQALLRRYQSEQCFEY